MLKRSLRIILFLLFLEIFLRIGGFVSLCIQDYHNRMDFNVKQAYRILCVGESMTMGGYPKQLEAVLNQKGLSKKFYVIDKGIAGVTSDTIMGAMEGYLDTYKPDMVIAMMGINDSSYEPFLVQVQGGAGSAFYDLNRFFYDLRVCKLFRGIYKDFKIKFGRIFHFSVSDSVKVEASYKVRQSSIYDERPDYSQGPSDENTGKAMRLGLIWFLTKDYADAEHIFRLLIQDPKAKVYNSKSTFIHYLALILYQESKTKELMLDLESVPYQNWYDIPVINLCGDQQNAGYVIASLKNLHKEFPGIPFYSDMAAQCYERSGNAREAGIWEQKALDIKNGVIYIKTKSNYLKLLDLLKKKNIVPVLMQYPVRDVGSLKSIVQSAPDNERVIFIDNQKVFDDAVRNEGYDAIFSDYYAGDFGHPTPKGGRILAENIAKTLITAMGWK